jgi:hypothetical protein
MKGAGKAAEAVAERNKAERDASSAAAHVKHPLPSRQCRRAEFKVPRICAASVPLRTAFLLDDDVD